MQYAVTASKRHFIHVEVKENLKPIIDTLYRVAGVDPDQMLAASIVELPSQDVPAAQKKLFDSFWRDGDLEDSSSDADEEYFGRTSQAMQVDAPAESIGDGQLIAPPTGHPSGAKRGRKKKEQEIPAVPHKEAYAFASAAVLDDKETVLPRDYLLVLTACSMHAWTSPLQLHKVCSLMALTYQVITRVRLLVDNPSPRLPQEVIRVENLLVSAELMVNFDDEKDEHDRMESLASKATWAKVVHERVKEELKTLADKSVKKRVDMEVSKVLRVWKADQQEREKAAGQNASAS